MSKFLKLCCLFLILSGCSAPRELVRNPNSEAPQVQLPAKKDLWIFVMAGQSNMAGRATVEAQDAQLNERIFTINSLNEIVIAREPLHFYERGTGLDCGLSFGTAMLQQVPDNVSLLLIPTAVGGSSIEQWIRDETHRGVQLLSNFKQRLEMALKFGVLKGILWHQGEADAHHEAAIQSYRENLEHLFEQFRNIAQNRSLPIVIGKLGSFATNQASWDRINVSIEAYALSDEHCKLVETADLKDKGDKIHFNSAAQRALGKRYAEVMLGLILE